MRGNLEIQSAALTGFMFRFFVATLALPLIAIPAALFFVGKSKICPSCFLGFPCLELKHSWSASIRVLGVSPKLLNRSNPAIS